MATPNSSHSTQPGSLKQPPKYYCLAPPTESSHCNQSNLCKNTNTIISKIQNTIIQKILSFQWLPVTPKITSTILPSVYQTRSCSPIFHLLLHLSPCFSHAEFLKTISISYQLIEILPCLKTQISSSSWKIRCGHPGPIFFHGDCWLGLRSGAPFGEGLVVTSSLNTLPGLVTHSSFLLDFVVIWAGASCFAHSS